jgi:cytohesin
MGCCCSKLEASHRPLTATTSPQAVRPGEVEFDEDDALRAQRSEHTEREKALQKGAHLFNTSGQAGMGHLLAKGLLTTPEEVATFLYSLTLPDGARWHERLNKQRVGEYLGAAGVGPEGREFHSRLLAAYLAAFDLEGIGLVPALRRWLQEFRLPGEAQVIDRLLSAFGAEFMRQNGAAAGFPSADAVWTLAFAAIMLNTDLHKRSVKRKMTEAQFVANFSHVEAGGVVPPTVLRAVYADVAAKPLNLELDCDVVTFFAPAREGWLLKRSSSGIQRWRRRYFLLTDSCLYYFIEPTDVTSTRPRFILPLENATVLSLGPDRIRM